MCLCKMSYNNILTLTCQDKLPREIFWLTDHVIGKYEDIHTMFRGRYFAGVREYLRHAALFASRFLSGFLSKFGCFRFVIYTTRWGLTHRYIHSEHRESNLRTLAAQAVNIVKWKASSENPKAPSATYCHHVETSVFSGWKKSSPSNVGIMQKWALHVSNWSGRFGRI